MNQCISFNNPFGAEADMIWENKIDIRSQESGVRSLLFTLWVCMSVFLALPGQQLP